MSKDVVSEKEQKTGDKDDKEKHESEESKDNVEGGATDKATDAKTDETTDKTKVKEEPQVPKLSWKDKFN
jgi:hypothetical protein